jgi:ectoine hydroxylase-related dioxygenase (phytanoyl-CoA dioxygenase family)
MAMNSIKLGIQRCMLSVGAHGRSASGYVVSNDAIEQFHEEGYALLPDFMSEAELKPIEEVYNRFMSGEIPVPGKDFCDMSAGWRKTYEEFSIVNCMLPRVYYPAFAGNAYEVRAAHVAAQLFPDVEMGIDYDQLLDKKPGTEDAVFAYHQDMAYWPPTPDTRTVTFSLALDSTTKLNGALGFVAGSHKEPELRPHEPVGESREDGHAVAVKLYDTDEVDLVETPRGSVTIHNERVVHGSGGNNSSGHRRTYVVAFRTAETIALERAMGFTHSHNDTVNWDTFNDHKKFED